MSTFMLATQKSRQPGSMRKRASPVATRLHRMGELMYTWLPHHRLNAGIIGVGKRLYYQAQSHGCPGLVDFLTARIPIYSLTMAPSGLQVQAYSVVLRKLKRRTPLSEGHSLRGIISSRIAYYQRQSGNHHLYCIWQCVLVDGKLGGYSEDRTLPATWNHVIP